MEESFLSDKNERDLILLLRSLQTRKRETYVQSWLLQGYICLVKGELIKRLKDRHHQGEPLVTEEDVESAAKVLARTILPSPRFNEETY